MRLSYTSTTPPSPDPSAAQAYAQLAARRSPNALQPLDLTLLHSPSVASGWSSFLGAIRTQTALSADIRELCICRVAVLNGATYEWEHHLPILEGEGGLAEDGVQEVKIRKSWQGWDDLGEHGKVESGAEGAAKTLNERQCAVLAYTDAMTVSVKVPDTIFNWVRRKFTEKEIVEITSIIAAYNCVSRFLVALDVGEMNKKVIQ